MMKDVVVKKSTIRQAGKGVFAKRMFKRGDVIGRYTGKMYDAKTVPENSLYVVEINKNCYVDAVGKSANFTRFIQHSGDTRTENAALVVYPRKRIAEVVCYNHDIAPGDEIFFDYGKSYWESLGVSPSVPPLQPSRKKR